MYIPFLFFFLYAIGCIRTPCSLGWCVASRIGSVGAGTSYVAATAQVPNRDVAL